MLCIETIDYIVIDAIGLKVYGKGEWETHKHDKAKPSIWCKLHLSVEASTHEAIVVEVSLVSVGDNEILPTID
ncbi:transposase [Candidatus Enterovibrio escicola]|uniref:transposase n=1 Tax=Candidatus Enterovibrio escicola TaxID=1927127 RepID=UPI00123824BD|nr:transposase [Candidatus Enterovibrio escacola]